MLKVECYHVESFKVHIWAITAAKLARHGGSEVAQGSNPGDLLWRSRTRDLYVHVFPTY